MNRTTTDQARVHGGVPAGGQFATETRSEADVSLVTPGTASDAHAASACTHCGHRIITVDGVAVHDAAGYPKWSAVKDGSPLCEGASERPVPAHIDELARGLVDLGAQWPAIPYAEDAVATAVRAAERGGYPDVPADYAAALLLADRQSRDHLRTNDGPLGYTLDPAGQGQAIGEAHASGMPVDWPEQMSLRGREWERACVLRWNEGVTANHLADLERHGLPLTPALARALVGTELAGASTWIEAVKADEDFSRYAKRYLDFNGIGQYVRDGVPLEDVQLAYSHDLEPGVARTGLTRPDGSVEKGPDAIGEIAQYKAACGMSEDHAREGIRAGVEAKTMKAFGPRVAATEIGQLQEVGVPAKVARSLRGRDQQMSVETITTCHAAGITSGADYKGWLAVTEKTSSGGMGHRRGTTSDLPAALALSKAGVPLAAAQSLKSQGIPAGAIGAMHAGGVTDWSPWRTGVHGRTQVAAKGQDQVAALTHVADFARAGGTPEQFARAQRAGVPLSDLGSHVTSGPAALWDAGAANRAAVLAEEKRVHEQWGPRMAAEPAPWPVTGPDDL